MIDDEIKSVVALHDLSSFGRCALTVICPTLTSMGVQVCPVPTTLMSTHTGGFEGFFKKDTSDFMIGALQHFEKLHIHFDAVYTGYLGDEKQIDIIKRYFKQYKHSIKLVDPVLGDDGKLYSTITAELVNGMKDLCELADIITPNITEAALLLNEQANINPNLLMLDDWLLRLSQGKRSVVITGVNMFGISNIGYDVKMKQRFVISDDKLPSSYPGTGDVFTSVLLGGLLFGLSLEKAAVKASDFTRYCISKTQMSGDPIRNGVLIEKCINRLSSGV